MTTTEEFPPYDLNTSVIDMVLGFGKNSYPFNRDWVDWELKYSIYREVDEVANQQSFEALRWMKEGDAPIVESIRQRSRKAAMHIATHGIGGRPLQADIKSECRYIELSKTHEGLSNALDGLSVDIVFSSLRSLAAGCAIDIICDGEVFDLKDLRPRVDDMDLLFEWTRRLPDGHTYIFAFRGARFHPNT